MLMDYIEGLNLDILRVEQPERRFSLPLVLAIMKPIVDALIYLHSQNPPIVHRDIKPSNIIVSTSGGEAVLVDFGLAKEYTKDDTTTIIRHGSPGFAAPEQYGSGTNPRTDIYGLAATLYTLLTGTVPFDAITRVSGSRGIDPLVPIHLVVPSVSWASAMAIEKAMSISSDDRFNSIEDFWRELNSHTPDQQMHQSSGMSLDLPQPFTLPMRDSEKNLAEQFKIVTRALADTPSSIDLLGFSDYAEALADFIKNEETEKPLTIAIDAAWGMGKTSLMKMIKIQLEKRLDKTEKMSSPLVWFNAWKYDQEGSLGAALVLEILDQIRKHFNLWQWIQFWCKLNWKRFDRELLLESILKSLATISAIVLLGILGIIIFILASHWPGEYWFESDKRYYYRLLHFGYCNCIYYREKSI